MCQEILLNWEYLTKKFVLFSFKHLAGRPVTEHNMYSWHKSSKFQWRTIMWLLWCRTVNWPYYTRYRATIYIKNNLRSSLDSCQILFPWFRLEWFIKCQSLSSKIPGDPTCNNGHILFFSSLTKYKLESTNSSLKLWFIRSNCIPTYLSFRRSNPNFFISWAGSE